MPDPGAFVGVDEVAAAITGDPDTWHIETHETRSRPRDAAGTYLDVTAWRRWAPYIESR